VLVNRTLPAIGARIDEGIFAGVTLHNNEAFALVLLPGDFNGTWAEAKDWADKEGGVLPSRIDQIVLFKNVKSEFKEAYYWSRRAARRGRRLRLGPVLRLRRPVLDDVSGARCRARAVRRIAIR
jgi:hypothetical protein